MVEDGAAAGASEPISMLTGGSKPVHRFLKGQPKCIGIVLVMMGVCLVMFAIATDFQSDLFTSDELWCPFWLGTLFFISGLLYILSERNPSKKMITASLALSIISTIGAFCACVEFSKAFSGIYYIYLSDFKQNQTEEERRHVKQHYMTIEKMEQVFFCHSVIGGILLVIMASFARAGLRSSRTQTRGTRRMVQESNVILLEEVLHQAGVLNCSVVLLKDPVITAQTGPSVRGMPAATDPHSQSPFDAPAHPEAPFSH